MPALRRSARRKRRPNLPLRPASRGRTPTVRCAASGCREFAAPSPRRWSKSAQHDSPRHQLRRCRRDGVGTASQNHSPGIFGLGHEAHDVVVRDPGGGVGAARARRAQCEHRRRERRNRLQGVREFGRGGRYAPRLGGARHSPRGSDGRFADRRRTDCAGGPGPLGGVQRRRASRRHVHDQQSGGGGRHVQHADHQSPGSGHPALGPLALAVGGPRGKDREAADDAVEPLLRSSRCRRGRRRAVPQRRDRLPPIARQSCC